MTFSFSMRSDLFRAVSLACDSKDYRQFTHGVYLEPLDGKLYIVATRGSILTAACDKMTCQCEKPFLIEPSREMIAACKKPQISHLHIEIEDENAKKGKWEIKTPYGASLGLMGFCNVIRENYPQWQLITRGCRGSDEYAIPKLSSSLLKVIIDTAKAVRYFEKPKGNKIDEEGHYAKGAVPIKLTALREGEGSEVLVRYESDDIFSIVSAMRGKGEIDLPEWM